VRQAGLPACRRSGVGGFGVDSVGSDRLAIEFASLYPGLVATDATFGDGMAPTNEISEDEAVQHMLRAIRARRQDHLFPRSTAWQIRLAQLAPNASSTRS
jgi:hypothetical protein